MRRWGLPLALLLSVGVNLGVLATLALHRRQPPPAVPPAVLPTAVVPTPVPPAKPTPVSPAPLPSPLSPAPQRPPEPVREPAPQPVRPPDVAGEPVEAEPEAEPPQGRGPEGLRPGGLGLRQRLERLADRLELAGTERRQFLRRQRQFFAETLAGRRQLDLLHRELRRELTAPQPDRERLDGVLAEIAQTYGTIERAFVSNVLDTRAHLDPEQERIFLQFVAQVRPGRALAPNGRGQRWRLRRELPAGPRDGVY
jgi:hypothetical protein